MSTTNPMEKLIKKEAAKNEKLAADLEAEKKNSARLQKRLECLDSTIESLRHKMRVLEELNKELSEGRDAKELKNLKQRVYRRLREEEARRFESAQFQKELNAKYGYPEEDNTISAVYMLSP